MRKHHTNARSAGRLLTIRDVATRLSISTRTLRSLIAAGRLPVVRVSPGRVAIDPRDLEDYLSRNRSSSEV